MKLDEAKKYLNRLRIGRSASGKDDKPTQALEQQEPLDHIRAEIDRIYNTLDELKRFIDKYRTESEGKE